MTVTPSNGYSGTVKLSAAGLPTGATATFSPASISKSGSATLTISTASTTPAGTYTVTVTGADSTGSLSKTATVTLTVHNSASTVTVSAINYTVSGSGYSTLNITLTTVNNLNATVAGAVVSITLNYNGVAEASAAAQTGSNGQVTFTLANAKAGDYNTVVTKVSASGLTWNGTYPSETVYDPY